ncbi:MAG: phosphoribosylformylglycinamidine synthase subunit PurL [Chloroflexi bacterium]|nr:phosphoribosylformylglycinamidine synthase subunit PurL [Chloroflexota bacterium]
MTTPMTTPAAPVVSAPTPDAPPLHRALGLTDGELDAIRDRLGRDPNDLELAMFSVMWSEHCSYKSSKPLLRTLPTGGGDVVAGPGENAGIMRIGEGLAVAFKLESHNHPSAVEPVQGAMTGVGGILRDIFTMGARPIAVLDGLHFGDPSKARTRHLVRGVVKGVGSYGNCVGVPTVGGELTFHPSYDGNPLVNVMAVGILPEHRIMLARADRPGDLAVLFGSTTGRDGIGGASVLASATFGEAEATKRPSVQIGDPFAEKLLIEASLELIERGLVDGLQDLGAAGITCAVSETADRSGTGIRVDLDAIPRREAGMEPFEVMISESQERMLALVDPAQLDAVLEVCRRWDLPAAVIGVVTQEPLISIWTGGLDGTGRPRSGATELARIPAAALTSDAIVHERVGEAPTRRRAAPSPGDDAAATTGLPERGVDPAVVLQALLGHPDLASRAWVTRQYDATVGASTVAGNEHGAAVLRVPGTTMGLAMATDSAAPVGLLDPRLGAALAVATSTLNVAVTGARPLGITNCLNYGSPERPEAFWQLQQGVAGLGDACRALDLPVTGGNVSLYNESAADGAIAPTCQVGVVGLLDDVSRVVGPAFRGADDVVGLLGTVQPGLAGSVYASIAGGAPDDRPPSLDLAAHGRLLGLLHAAATAGLLRSAQDVGGGGLAVALAECAMWGEVGALVELRWPGSPATALFGEGPSRVVVTTTAEGWQRLAVLAAEHGVPLERLGVTGGDRLRIELAGASAQGPEERGPVRIDLLDAAIGVLREAWEHGLPRALGDEGWTPGPGGTPAFAGRGVAPTPDAVSTSSVAPVQAAAPAQGPAPAPGAAPTPDAA